MLWFRLKEQRKNNKGSSLVMVIIVMALVVILVSSIMSMTVMNIRMKQTGVMAQKTFYNAESALTELKAGLALQISKAAAAAYNDTMEHYAKEDEAGRNARYASGFRKEMERALQCNVTASTYSISYLGSLLKKTAYDASSGTGADISAPDNNNIYNVTGDGILLKNVTVTYRDSAGYVTKLQTDIALGRPKITFGDDAGMPVLSSFALVAGTAFEVDANRRCEVYGNAYLGKEENKMGEGAALVFGKNPSSPGKELLIAGSTLKGENNSSVTISDMELWAENFHVDSSSARVTDSAVYLKNDLALGRTRGTPASARFSGEFYAYGNLKTAEEWAREQGLVGELSDLAAHPADYSSSLIVNGTGISGTEKSVLDLSGLSTLRISGSSYVNAQAQKSKAEGVDHYPEINAADVLMGESISTRTSQLAYLVPADCIAPGMVNGGTNPMPVKQYSALLEELEEEYPDSAPEEKLVDLDLKSNTLNETLRNYGVFDWQVEAHQLVNVGSMIYVFSKFDSQEAANHYFDLYYHSVGSAKLEGLLDQTFVSIRMPDDTSPDQFYFNGNILAGEGTKLYVPAKLETLTAEQKLVQENEEKQYRGSYEALRHNLVKSYGDLSAEQKARGPFDNLVKSMVSATDPNYTIAENDDKKFVKSTGEAAVIVRGNYHIDSTADSDFKQVGDYKGSLHPNAELHVVIATGNVTVDKDFTGLILAGGNISVSSNVKVTSDDEAVRLALMACEEGSGIHPYDYLVNGRSYILAGSEEGPELKLPTEETDMLSYVTYENWSRQ